MFPPRRSDTAAAAVSAPAAAAATHREQQAVAAVTETEKKVVRPLTASASCSQRVRERPGHCVHADLCVHTWLRASAGKRGLESL